MVTTVLDGVDHAMTASAFTSVSLRPPQVLICADNTSRFTEAVLASGTWGVSILSQGNRDASAWFARRGRPLAGQLAEFGHARGDTGVALINDALAWLECLTVATHPGGDHTIIVGQVVSARVGEGDDPLMYYRSHYGTIVRSSESEKTINQGDS